MDEVQKILELEGVTVKRPEVIDWSKPIKTPWFEAQGKATVQYLLSFLSISIYQVL